VLGVAEPVQSGTEFGLPEPVTCCAGATADKATSSELMTRNNLRRFIVILQIDN
jgi:hypothetical protein